MKTWWKIRRLSSFLFPSPLFLLFSDWFLPACPCSVCVCLFLCFVCFSPSLAGSLPPAPGFFLVSPWWFGVCSWRRIIRLTNTCSFSALHLRFESKGKAGMLSFCSLPVSLFFGPLLFSEHLSTLSRPVSSLVFLGSVLVRESLFLVWEFWR